VGPKPAAQSPWNGVDVRFAINVYGRFSVNYFARNMDNLLVGWRFDAPTLGYYKKAYDLFALSPASSYRSHGSGRVSPQPAGPSLCRIQTISS